MRAYKISLYMNNFPEQSKLEERYHLDFDKAQKMAQELLDKELATPFFVDEEVPSIQEMIVENFDDGVISFTYPVRYFYLQAVVTPINLEE